MSISVARDGTGDYVCDGIADDVQIQMALDSICESGGVLFIKQGEYDITAVLRVYSNVTIIGAGYNTRLKLAAAKNIPIITNSNAPSNSNDSIIIRDICFDQNQSLQTEQTFVGCLSFFMTDNLTIQHNWFENGIDGFISCENECVNVKVLDNKCSNWGKITGGAAISLRLSTRDSIIAGNHISGGSFKNETPGIQCIWGVYDVLIFGNTVIDGQHGIEATGAYTDGAKTRCERIKVINNICKGQTLSAIKMEQDTINSQISGNLVSGNRPSSSADDCIGIFMWEGRMGCISNNIVLNMGGHGIAALCRDKNFTEELIISGNRVEGCGLHGILIDRSNDTIISSNIVKNNSKATTNEHEVPFDGIHILNSSKVVVMGNRCFDSDVHKHQGYGIRSVNSNHLCVTSNIVTDNLLGSISLAGVRLNNVKANNIC